MNTALIKTLKGVPTNGNLPLFNAIRLKVKNNGSTLQNINFSSTEKITYEIQNRAFSFANTSGVSLDVYSVEVDAGRNLFTEGYEIPANAVGEIIVKNTLNVTELGCNRGNFEIDAEDLYDLQNVSQFTLNQYCKIIGDVTPMLASMKSLTVFSAFSNNDMLGNFKEVVNPSLYTMIKTQNTSMSGDITDFSKFINLTTLWLTNNNFVGTIEDLVSGLVANGKTSGTISLAVNGTQVTFQGRLTDKGADLTWDGENNITYNAFN